MSDTQSSQTIPPWTLGWRLQRALSWADMTSEEMGAELGYSRQMISRWMNDHGAPPRRAVVKQWALLAASPTPGSSTASRTRKGVLRSLFGHLVALPQSPVWAIWPWPVRARSRRSRHRWLEP